jgi:hypothetical protein
MKLFSVAAHNPATLYHTGVPQTFHAQTAKLMMPLQPLRREGM